VALIALFVVSIFLGNLCTKVLVASRAPCIFLDWLFNSQHLSNRFLFDVVVLGHGSSASTSQICSSVPQ